jgi:hypothetical protein
MILVCAGCHRHIDTAFADQWFTVTKVKRLERLITYHFCSKECMLGTAPVTRNKLEPAPKPPPQTNYLRIRLKKRKATE